MHNCRNNEQEKERQVDDVPEVKGTLVKSKEGKGPYLPEVLTHMPFRGFFEARTLFGDGG